MNNGKNIAVIKSANIFAASFAFARISGFDRISNIII